MSLTKLCSSCGLERPLDQYHSKQSRCKECRSTVRAVRYGLMTPEERLFSWAKARAKIKGRPFTIRLEDIEIPDVCPVLGTPLVTTSIDRIDPEKGYVPGNVRVISMRANVLKNNAELWELEALVTDLKRIRVQSEYVFDRGLP